MIKTNLLLLSLIIVSILSPNNLISQIHYPTVAHSFLSNSSVSLHPDTLITRAQQLHNIGWDGISTIPSNYWWNWNTYVENDGSGTYKDQWKNALDHAKQEGLNYFFLRNVFSNENHSIQGEWVIIQNDYDLTLPRFIPEWFALNSSTNQELWDRIIDNFAAAADFAQHIGAKGIMLDTENYQTSSPTATPNWIWEWEDGWVGDGETSDYQNQSQVIGSGMAINESWSGSNWSYFVQPHPLNLNNLGVIVEVYWPNTASPQYGWITKLTQIGNTVQAGLADDRLILGNPPPASWYLGYHSTNFKVIPTGGRLDVNDSWTGVLDGWSYFVQPNPLNTFLFGQEVLVFYPEDGSQYAWRTTLTLAPNGTSLEAGVSRDNVLSDYDPDADGNPNTPNPSWYNIYHGTHFRIEYQGGVQTKIRDVAKRAAQAMIQQYGDIWLFSVYAFYHAKSFDMGKYWYAGLIDAVEAEGSGKLIFGFERLYTPAFIGNPDDSMEWISSCQWHRNEFIKAIELVEQGLWNDDFCSISFGSEPLLPTGVNTGFTSSRFRAQLNGFYNNLEYFQQSPTDDEFVWIYSGSAGPPNEDDGWLDGSSFNAPYIRQLACKVVKNIPFTDIGSTVGSRNKWDVQGSDGADEAYLLKLNQTTMIDITLCSSNTNYDTKIEIFNADGSRAGYYRDDYSCTYSGLYSSIYNVQLNPGDYFIVVDGYGGSTGNYEIQVTPSSSEMGDHIIVSLPYEHSGSNVGHSNDWDVRYSDGADVAYRLYLDEPTSIDVTLCSQNTNYDTKLEIFYPSGSSTGFYNDDYSCNFSGLYSSLYNISLSAGEYYVVVDGYNGKTGNYGLSVRESGLLKNLITTNHDEMYQNFIAEIKSSQKDFDFSRLKPFNDFINAKDYLYELRKQVNDGHPNITYQIAITPPDDMEETYLYELEKSTENNSSESLIPETTKLYIAYPQPFNPTTNIQYDLSSASYVTLVIYNILGEEIIRLVDDEKPVGAYAIQWNGKDKNHNTIASGVYLYRLEAKSEDGKVYEKVRKLLLIK